jgi:hypothetical protein
MITLNKKSPEYLIRPIVHKGNPERVGKIMTQEEIHEFGLGLLIAFLDNQDGKLIGSNANLWNEYPHLVVESPKKELLYIWIKTEMYPIIPSIVSIENHEKVINYSNQFNAIPVFAGIRLSCVSTKEKNIPVYGAEYIAEFTGFKTFY